MGFREMLGIQRDEKQQELDELMQARAKLDVQVREVRAYLEALNPLLAREGLAVVAIPDDKIKVPTGFAAPGNRSTDMPARQTQFAQMTMADAVKTVLESIGPQHADDIARRIFEVTSPRDLKRAKHTLVSTLSNGAKAGRWRRIGPNLFAANSTPVSENGQSLKLPAMTGGVI